MVTHPSLTDPIYILVPVHNRREVTRRLMECLTAQTVRGIRLVLVDDGSTDGTSAMVHEYFPDAAVIRGDGNLWWGGALQKGYAYIRKSNVREDDFVLILNDDTEFLPDFLETGIQLLNGRRGVFLQAASFSRRTGEFLDAGVRANWKKLTFEPVRESPNCLSTRGLLFRFADLQTTGGFHPVLLPHYASDYEFTLRASRKGISLESSLEFRLNVDESTTGIHNVTGARRRDRFKELFSKRSATNPIYFSSFVLLACPWKYVPINLFRIWRGAWKQIFRPGRFLE